MKKKLTLISAVVASLVMSACGGSGSSSSNDSSSDTTVAKRVKNAALDDPWSTPCSKGGACQAGDTGPGGGVIFYAGTTEYNKVDGVSNGGVYMEGFNYTNDGYASRAPWGCFDGVTKAEVNPAVVGADALTFGSGAQNTKDIVVGCKDEGIAAKIAYNSTQGGQNDWFLPSIHELEVFCQYMHGQAPSIDVKVQCDRKSAFIPSASYAVKNLGNYWSSTEANTIRAMEMNPTWKNQNNHKHYTSQVLLVRSFGTAPSTPAPNPRVYKCIYGGPCKVGETGPGGGTIFYTGDSVIGSYGDKYKGGKSLEFLDYSSKTYKFKCAIHVHDLKTGLGAGAENTARYRAVCSDTDSPVVLATNASNGGKSDWFIPSMEDLNQICRYSRGQTTGSTEQCNGKSKIAISGNSFNEAQWSSNQFSEKSMYARSFGDGTSVARDKNKYSYKFFLVRATG
jgi:hypothetical protein